MQLKYDKEAVPKRNAFVLMGWLRLLRPPSVPQMVNKRRLSSFLPGQIHISDSRLPGWRHTGMEKMEREYRAQVGLLCNSTLRPPVRKRLIPSPSQPRTRSNCSDAWCALPMASRQCTNGTPSAITCNSMESSLSCCLSSHLFSSIAVCRFPRWITRMTRGRDDINVRKNKSFLVKWFIRAKENKIRGKLMLVGFRTQAGSSFSSATCPPITGADSQSYPCSCL